MRVLVVDDNDTKRSRVRELLVTEFGEERSTIIDAEDYEQAMAALERTQFDLVVLDLLIPGAGHGPSIDSSRAIIRAVLQGTSMMPPTHIIGLTAYGEMAESEAEYYNENLFALEVYSDVDNTWMNRIRSKLRYLIKSKKAAVAFQANSFDLDFVVLAARYENEYKPIRSKLFSSTEGTSQPSWVGEITLGTMSIAGKRTLRGALCCVGEMGMAPAAAMASQAITTFRPRLLSMLGMCCGFDHSRCASPRRMMDAIIVREVACWEEGRYVEEANSASEFKNRAKARLVDDVIRADIERAVEAGVDRLAPSLRKFAETAAYKRIRAHFGEDRVRAVPDVQFAPIVSGSSVIADAAMVEEILERNPKALGLDMELYGVYTAAEKINGARPSVIGIKGVADHGTKDKDDAAQKQASLLSTVVFKDLVKQLAIW